MPVNRNICCTCKKCVKKSVALRMVTPDLHRRHMTDNGPSHLTPPDVLQKFNLIAASSTAAGSSSRSGRRGLGDRVSAAAGGTPASTSSAAGVGEPDNLGGGMEGIQEQWMEHGEGYQQQQPDVEPPRRTAVHGDIVWQDAGPEPKEFNAEEERMDAIPALPPAYAKKEPAGVRIGYLGAVVNNVCQHLSVEQTDLNLKVHMQGLAAAGVLPTDPTPVTTYASVRRRLGTDPDDHIIEYACCNVCWKHYLPEEMQALTSPACIVLDCPGVIYEEERNASNKIVRKACLISPQVSLIHSLRRIVHRKGFRKLVRDSRNTPTNQNDDPEFVMKDIHDGAMWHDMKTGIKREVGRDAGNNYIVRDIERSEGEEKKLTDHRFGLHMTVNTDWFGAVKHRPHSSGPIYISIADLPRDQRFLQVNVICVGIAPGPKEPNAQQIIHFMEPMARDVQRLKNGVKMDMYAEDDKTIVSEDVYADILCDDCDTPGARKFAGHAVHNSNFNPCPWCKATLPHVNMQCGYVPSSFQMKDDTELLGQKFRSKNSGEARQDDIANRFGVRFSAMDWIPGWRPAKQTPLDFMHCIFLGLIAFLFNVILVGAHMFGGTGGSVAPKQRFEDALNSVQWPSHITRLPKNMGHNQSVKKADEWRQLITVTPVILWLTWRDPDDSIPDTEPPVAPNEKINTTHCRKRLSLYSVILYLCAAVRLLSTKTISMAQAATGQQYLVNYCQRMLLLGVELTVNHHLAMHFEGMIRLYGPVYGWWLFAYERFNGMLEKVNLNGHDGGRMELTMLRNWVQAHLIYDLLLALPDDAQPYEKELLSTIIKSEGRGTMLHELAVLQSEVSVDSVRLPRRSRRRLDLHRYTVNGEALNINLYEHLFQQATHAWPDVRLRRELSSAEGTTFLGNSVARRLPFIKKDGIRYGCVSNNRTKKDSWAFIRRDSVRVPIQILDLFMLEISVQQDVDRREHQEQPKKVYQHICALIRRLHSDDNMPPLPWDVYAKTLGIYTSYAEEYAPPEVIAVNELDSALALIPADHFTTGKKLWISVSFDHVATEPEEEWVEEGGDE